jgi:hypothetical protein
MRATATTPSRSGWLLPVAVLLTALLNPLIGVTVGVIGLAKMRTSRPVLIATVLLMAYLVYFWSTAHWVIVDSGGAGTGFDR